MSQQNSNSSSVNQSKQLVFTVVRYGQIIGVYNKFDDALIIIQDYAVKGLPFDVSAKYLQ